MALQMRQPWPEQLAFAPEAILSLPRRWVDCLAADPVVGWGKPEQTLMVYLQPLADWAVSEQIGLEGERLRSIQLEPEIVVEPEYPDVEVANGAGQLVPESAVFAQIEMLEAFEFAVAS